MDLNYFDLIIGAIILLLGLKGILNGFFKEIFGLIGIIGGVFVASRVGDDIGKFLSDSIFKLENESAIKFTGFLVTLIAFWALMIFLGSILKRLSKLSGLGVFDKILGFVVGSGKFFLIISIIVFAIWNVKTIRVNIEDSVKNSIFFPIMVQTGGFIMKLDPIDSVEKLKEKEQELQQKIEDTIQNEVIKNTKDIIEKNLSKTNSDLNKTEE